MLRLSLDDFNLFLLGAYAVLLYQSRCPSTIEFNGTLHYSPTAPYPTRAFSQLRLSWQKTPRYCRIRKGGHGSPASSESITPACPNSSDAIVSSSHKVSPRGGDS